MKIMRFRQLLRKWTIGWVLGISLIAFVVSIAAPSSHAQAAAEAAAATGASSVAASSAKPVAGSARKNSQPGSALQVPANSGPPADETNRKNFEEHAGKNAGKLMLHSMPDGAQVFVNGLYVGHAPLLLLLAPAKYKVEMRGQRQEFGQRTIAVAPDETQEVVVTLASMYPGKVSTR